MIKEINISDLALMDNIHFSLYPGLNVFTGETGSGKSNLISAISLVLGQRASEDYIRAGKEQAFIEALFDISDNHEVKEILANNGFEEIDEMVISRSINRKGKNSCRINGHLVTISVLQDIASHLMELQGQHESQILFNVSKHLDFLDQFCGKSIFIIREKIERKYRELKSIEKKIEELKQDINDREHKIDFLKFEINEIESASLETGEEERLINEKIFLSNIEKISRNLSDIFSVINQDMGFEYVLDSIYGNLKEISSMDDKLCKLSDRFGDLYYESGDFISDLKDYSENLEFNQDRFDEVLSRLNIIAKLKNKYGSAVTDILAYLEKSKDELLKISNAAEYNMELEEKMKELKSNLLEDMKELSEKRKKGGLKLEKAVNGELKDIGMEKAMLKIFFKNEDVPFEDRMKQSGIDDIEFLFSANKGEPLKSLAKIASGGEISRVMLALKSSLAEIKFMPSLIFDEIDAGLGGEAAARVGGKLLSLSKNYQILCVTHLPQIASLGDNHFLLYKKEIDGRMVSRINELTSEERVIEISRMLEGKDYSQASMALAVKLLGI